MLDLSKKIKIAMIKNNREDFTQYLAEILCVSKQAASKRFLGKTKFSDADMERLRSILGPFED